MWKLVGMTILLSRGVMANSSDENAYYLSQSEDDRSLEILANRRETTLETSEATRLSENTNDERAHAETSEDHSRLNSEPKRSIVRLNLRDERSEQRRRRQQQQQAPAPLATLLYWPDHEDQIIGMENRRNPLIQERRNPSFSPWGGKRNTERYETMKKIRRPPRVPFNSWGGKRNDEKIDSSLDNMERYESVNRKGKESTELKSWDGKRDTMESRLYYDVVSPTVNEQSASKMVKNDFGSRPDKSMNKEIKARRWDEITSSGGAMRDIFSKIPFEPWGGKRSRELRFNEDYAPSAGVSFIFQKIGPSIPWTE